MNGKWKTKSNGVRDSPKVGYQLWGTRWYQSPLDYLK